MYIFLLPLVIVTLLTLPVLSRIKHFSDGKRLRELSSATFAHSSAS